MYSEAWKQGADADAFWSLIALARQDFDNFRSVLRSLDRRELIRFAWSFDEAASRLGQERYRRFTDPDLSEDALDDLWTYVVGQGRAYYEDVLANPARMPARFDSSDPAHWVRYEASNAFFERYGQQLPPYGYDY